MDVWYTLNSSASKWFPIVHVDTPQATFALICAVNTMIYYCCHYTLILVSITSTYLPWNWSAIVGRFIWLHQNTTNVSFQAHLQNDYPTSHCCLSPYQPWWVSVVRNHPKPGLQLCVHLTTIVNIKHDQHAMSSMHDNSLKCQHFKGPHSNLT